MRRAVTLWGFMAVAMSAALAQEREAHFGDLHLHTKNSFDAYIYTRIDPDAAYRFARGESVNVMGREMKRSTRPLDFLAVTDHSEWMGVMNTLEDPDSVMSRKFGKDLRERYHETLAKLGWGSKLQPQPGLDSQAILRSTWQRAIEAANDNYQPGKFTTFIAYEWSSTPAGNHLHRNVIFRGDKAPNPFSSIDSIKPEDLWAFLENIRSQGYEALAIPHNSNMSNGLAFDWVDSNGRAIDQAYAERRLANEPLVEIAQNKGQSETHPALSANDEFASFEVMEHAPGGKSRLAGGYVRDALGRGMKIARDARLNPFKYGFVGASDFHNGVTDAAEEAYVGFVGAVDPTQPPMNPYQMFAQAGVDFESLRSSNYLYKASSGNLTGVWAEANTREAIYDALRRKETFATSGTRLKLRAFGGWGFERKFLHDRDWKAIYAQGVPMGSDLPPRPAGKRAPQFVLWAAKDPDGANLDRLQIVKVSLNKGRPAEKIYDVALAGRRRVDPSTGKSPQIGSTVDVQAATYTNTIGAAELATLWQDPDFDPSTSAVYYLRVLEIPTPRWSTILAARLGQKPPEGIPPVLQERGWASPLWYEPPAR